MERWDVINAVQRMQDYIGENINAPITLSDLAKAAGYSQWHSARLFKEYTGKSPFEYIRAIRLSKAALQLSDKQPKIIDVALDFVFDSHEGFTRAFHKEFGITPKRFSDNPKPLKLFMPYKVRDYYLALQKGDIEMSDKHDVAEQEVDKRSSEKPSASTVFVQVMERPSRKLIAKRGKQASHYFEYCEEVGCDIWDILSGIKEAMYEPAGMWLPESMIKPGTSKYIQGVEVSTDYQGEVPEGFEIIDLPPCKMMIFQGEPYDDERFEEAIYALWDVMEKYDPKIYGYEWADYEAPRFQLAPQGYRGYIEARPVKLLNKD